MSVELRINRGVAVLNDYFRGRRWLYRLNVSELDVNDFFHCVLAQLFGSYVDGRFQLTAFVETAYGVTISDRTEWAADHGFDVADDDEENVASLTEAWKARIDRLRAI